MDTVRSQGRRRPDAVAGDKAYSYPRGRSWLARRGNETVIPTRSNQTREPFVEVQVIAAYDPDGDYD